MTHPKNRFERRVAKTEHEGKKKMTDYKLSSPRTIEIGVSVGTVKDLLHVAMSDYLRQMTVVSPTEEVINIILEPFVNMKDNRVLKVKFTIEGR